MAAAGVSRSGRMRKKSAKVMEMEEFAEIESEDHRLPIPLRTTPPKNKRPRSDDNDDDIRRVAPIKIMQLPHGTGHQAIQKPSYPHPNHGNNVQSMHHQNNIAASGGGKNNMAAAAVSGSGSARDAGNNDSSDELSSDSSSSDDDDDDDDSDESSDDSDTVLPFAPRSVPIHRSSGQIAVELAQQHQRQLQAALAAAKAKQNTNGSRIMPQQTQLSGTRLDMNASSELRRGVSIGGLATNNRVGAQQQQHNHHSQQSHLHQINASSSSIAAPGGRAMQVANTNNRLGGGAAAARHNNSNNVDYDSSSSSSNDDDDDDDSDDDSDGLIIATEDYGGKKGKSKGGKTQPKRRKKGSYTEDEDFEESSRRRKKIPASRRPARTPAPKKAPASKTTKLNSNNSLSGATTTPPGGGDGNKGGAVKQKQSRPLTAYMLWAQEHRKKIVAENPGLDFASISKRLGLEWNYLSEKEKMFWRRRAKAPANKGSNLISTGKPPPPPKQQSAPKITPPPAPIPIRHSQYQASRSRAASGTTASLGATTPKKGCSATTPVSATTPIRPMGHGVLDVAAHLKLLGESLSIIGQRLNEHEGQIAVSGTLSVLLDSTLCALCPLICLTERDENMNGCSSQQLNQMLDNVAYIMPGL